MSLPWCRLFFKFYHHIILMIMRIELNRVDYELVGLTNRKCMKLLPSSSQGTPQKVAVGDQDGILHIFSMRKGELQSVFKTAPGPSVLSLELGGAAGSSRDKVFVACGSEVRGYTKKGKQFLSFDTNLLDHIKTMYVEGSDLFVCGSHNLNYFQDCKEAGSYISGDAVRDVVSLSYDKFGQIVVVLACEDKTIRLLDPLKVTHLVPLPSIPTVLSLMGEDKVLFGTAGGSVGMLHITRLEPKMSWVINMEGKGAEVTALSHYDLQQNGFEDCILGRHDGTVEVHTFPTEIENSKLIFSYCCNESVTAVQGGVVGSPGFDEIVVSTFSGWVFGLTTEGDDRNIALSTDSQNVRLSEEAKHKVIRLRNEIEDLEDKIHKEREKYQAMGSDNGEAMSAVPLIAINDNFSLNKDDASYTLALEVQSSIDNVLIQSDVPIDLLDVQKNSAVVSFSECDPADGNFLLATYRCQLNTTRLELKLRTIEGQYGTVRAYVTPNIMPKCCQAREYRVKPLSLHTRIHVVEPTRPFNTLTLKGQFSLAEIHTWIELCLPEVPVKPPQEPQTLCFASTFLDTMLQVTYLKGEAEFKSDNISTISILKDVLSKEATRSNKKRNIDITWNINEVSIPHTLSLIHPKLSHKLELQRLATIIEAMAEVDLDGGLTEEYTKIMANEKEILEEFGQQPAYLDRLYGMITDLYIDVFKFQGVQVKNRIPALLELLSADKYSYERLLQFFYSG